MLLEVVERDVGSEVHISEDANAARIKDVSKSVDDPLDARVVGCDAITDEPVGGGESVEQVDADVKRTLVLAKNVGRINSGGAGTDDGETQR